MIEIFRSKLLLSLMLVVAAVCGCTDRNSAAASRPQVDAAVDKTEAATLAAARKAAELAETARDKTVAFAKSPQVRQDAANAKQALGRAVDNARPESAPPAKP